MYKYVLFLFIYCNFSYSQQGIKNEYDTYLKGEKIGSFASIKKLAEQGTSDNFIIISTFIDANNTLFKKTNDFKYLILNQTIYDILSEKKVITARFSKNDQNHSLDKKESILFEGYLYRYFAEYFYILSKIDGARLKENQIKNDFSFLEERILYWHNLSLEKTSDDSFFQGIRVHMGAQWAYCFLYLSEISKNKTQIIIYNDFLARFDYNLKRNLKKIMYKNLIYYQWNSTWDNHFTNSLKKRANKINEQDEIQDSSHGNHIVSYIIAAYELKRLNWKLNDIKYLGNTLLLKIHHNGAFSDLINGKKSKELSLQNSGWKQSDGWMKLEKYIPKIFVLYTKYYLSKKEFLKETNSYTQYLANLYTNEI